MHGVPAVLVAEHELVRHRAVYDARGNPRVPRVDQTRLPLHEDVVVVRARLQHHALDGAGREVRDDAVDGDAVALDEDAGLARRDERRVQALLARVFVEFPGGGHLPDRAVGADGRDDGGVHAVRDAVRDADVRRRLPDVPELAAVFGRETRELRVVLEEVVEPGVDVTAAFERVPDVRPPGLVESAADGCDPDDERVHVVGDVGHRRDDGRVLHVRDVVVDARAVVVPVDDCFHVVVRVAEDADCRLRAARELLVGEECDFHTTTEAAGGLKPPSGGNPEVAGPTRRNARSAAYSSDSGTVQNAS